MAGAEVEQLGYEPPIWHASFADCGLYGFAVALVQAGLCLEFCELWPLFLGGLTSHGKSSWPFSPMIAHLWIQPTVPAGKIGKQKADQERAAMSIH